MATTTGLGALPTLEAMTRTTNVAQTDTTNTNQMGLQQNNSLDTTALNQQQNQSTNQQNQAMNQYTAGQQALQGQVTGMGQNLLNGNISSSFGLPQSVYDAEIANFNRFQAPMLAAQHGAGSPAIQAAMESLQLQLAGMGAKNAFQNALGAYDAAGKYAFTPIGNNQTQIGSNSMNNVTNQTQQGLSNQQTNNTTNQTNNRVGTTNEMQLNSGMDMSMLWEWLYGGGGAVPNSPDPGGSGVNPFRP